MKLSQEWERYLTVSDLATTDYGLCDICDRLVHVDDGIVIMFVVATRQLAAFVCSEQCRDRAMNGIAQ